MYDSIYILRHLKDKDHLTFACLENITQQSVFFTLLVLFLGWAVQPFHSILYFSVQGQGNVFPSINSPNLWN